MHLRVKKLNLDIFAHAVQAKLSHRFKHHPSPPPRQKEITHPPKKSFFFQKPIPLSERLWEETLSLHNNSNWAA